MNRARLIIIAIILLIFVIIINGGHFSFHGRPDGVYLLKGADGKLFELKDRLSLTEYERLIARIEFEAMYARWRSKEDAATAPPYLKYSWHKKAGRGYLISFFPDGTKFLACFGRSVEDSINPVKGLFLGGGLPESHYENASLKTNETGVVLFDGKEWHHLRRNTEEFLFSAADPLQRIKPGQWEFIDSKVLFASQFRLTIKSSHRTTLGSIPVRIDRYLIYHAGDRFFTLVNRLTNMGTSPLGYQYTCGNGSPTVNLRSSAGNEGCNHEYSITLLPGRAELVVQTIGMVNNDQKTEAPCEPAVTPDQEELEYFLSR